MAVKEGITDETALLIGKREREFLTIEHVCASYGKGFALKDVSFTAETGTLTALLGVNGSGKTTLLRTICQQMKHRGSCYLAAGDGCEKQDVSFWRGRLNGAGAGERAGREELSTVALEALSARMLARMVSYVPQRSGAFAGISIREVVLMGFHPWLGLLEKPNAGQRKQAEEALEALGLLGLAQRDFMCVSEGQKRLALLARLLVEDARLLVLDEPDGALDFPNRYGMMKMLADMVRGQTKAAVLSLHDPMLAMEFCDQVILLKDGCCIGRLYPARDSVTGMEEMLRAIYGPLTLGECNGKNGEKRRVILWEQEETCKTVRQEDA